MCTLQSAKHAFEPTLDVQMLEGLETYITTEKFLHTLEAASAEWIDLSDHQQQPLKAQGKPSTIHEAPPASQAGADISQLGANASQQPASDQQTRTSSSGWLRRWRSSPAVNRSTSSTSSDSPGMVQPAGAGRAPHGSAAACDTSSSSGAQDSSSSSNSEQLPPVVASFELVQLQAPLSESCVQEPFVMVSAEDAIEGMAYYIALYLSRAPEARYMEPKQLQAALRQTFTAIRRSRYRVIWDWGRCLYRWGAISYSALQLYEHPWVVRAVVAGVWASSKMAFGVLF